MKHISQESIDKAISVIDELNDEQLEKVFQTYASLYGGNTIISNSLS